MLPLIKGSLLRENKDITNSAIIGFRWKFFSTVSIVIMQLIFGIILARLLPPEVFGIFGYAMIFVGFISIYAQAGIAPAIVQRKNLTNEHIKVGFTLSVLLSILATFILWTIAPIFTKGIGTSILRIASLSFFLAGFGSVSSALLERKLDFKPLFWVEILSYGIGQGVISIGLATMGFGVWSLAYGILFYTLIKSLLLMVIAPHPVGFLLKRDRVKELMHFGLGMSLARFANYGARTGDYFVIGKLLQPEALGLYSRAFQIVTIPTSYFASLISSVLFPVYSVVQDDKQRLKRGFYLSVSLVSFVTFPIMVWLFIVARKLIPIVYGSAWSGSIHSLQILTICGAFGSIYTMSDALARAKGLVYAQFARHSLYATMVIAGAILGTRFGIEGVAYAVSFAVFIMYILMAQLSIKIIGGTWCKFFQAQIPGILIGICIAIIANGILLLCDKYFFTDLITLLILIISFILIYFLVFVSFPLSWFRGIPEFLLQRCSSFIPRIFLRFLSQRLVINQKSIE